MGTKINKLIEYWKPGFVFTSKFLKEHSIHYDQQMAYKKSGWLESLGYGAYKRKGDTVNWTGGLNALQNQLNLKVHLSGKSSLLMQGYSHYVYAQESYLYLNRANETKIPEWFKNSCTNNINLIISRTSVLPYDLPDSYTIKNVEGFDTKMSNPERASLEMLNYVPDKQSFDEAFKITAFLTTLRPKIIQQFLELCTSIKVKRLFLYMAEQHNHSWLDELDFDKFNLGSGKRVVVRNGVLNKKYQITVPREEAL